MESLDFLALKAKYDQYVDTFREASGKLPSMMQLKYTHTMMVVRNAELIVEGEGFSSQARSVAMAAALLHDTGRFEQLKRFDTFKDSESIDHAVFSYDIVKAQGWLESKEVLAAILYHNRRELPEGLDSLTLSASHTVRDADKLDIFRVLEEQVKTTDWRSDSRAFWNLKVGAPPNPAVIEAIASRKPVDYQNIQSLADFVLIQVGWMISGLHYATTRRLTKERGHLSFRRKFLAEIGGGATAEKLCDLAETIL